MGAKGEDESAFKLPPSWEGPVGKAKVANRTREIRPCGMTRGACGNVDQGGTRHPPRVTKERVLETLHLKLCAPQIYPDQTPMAMVPALVHPPLAVRPRHPHDSAINGRRPSPCFPTTVLHLGVRLRSGT